MFRSAYKPFGMPLHSYDFIFSIMAFNQGFLMKLFAIAYVSLFLLQGSPAHCQNKSNTEEPPQRSIDAFTHAADPSSGSLGLSSEYENSNGEYDQAIRLAAQALKKDPDDIDIRKRYAQSLENKLVHQKEKDPELFNTCVTAWLAILRNEAGDEKGLTLGGIGLPLSGQLFGDEERVMDARVHLQKLCGFLPKAWETDKHYLRRVLVHHTVKGEMRKPSTSDAQPSSENKAPAADSTK